MMVRLCHAILYVCHRKLPSLKICEVTLMAQFKTDEYAAELLFPANAQQSIAQGEVSLLKSDLNPCWYQPTFCQALLHSSCFDSHVNFTDPKEVPHMPSGSRTAGPSRKCSLHKLR